MRSKRWTGALLLAGALGACGTAEMANEGNAELGRAPDAVGAQWLGCSGPADELGKTVAHVDARLASPTSPENVVIDLQTRAETNPELARYRGLDFADILYEDMDTKVFGGRRDGIPTSVVVAAKAGDRWGSSLVMDCFRGAGS